MSEVGPIAVRILLNNFYKMAASGQRQPAGIDKKDKYRRKQASSACVLFLLAFFRVNLRKYENIFVSRPISFYLIIDRYVFLMLCVRFTCMCSYFYAFSTRILCF